jgi:acylphosphatase
VTESRHAVLVRISGRVQGVSFRAWTQDTAESLGLSGWVRNEPDGTVTAHIEGPPAAVEDMLARCRQGPRAARVSQVETVEAATGAMGAFEIR